jgi:hypothetical protein
MCDSAWAASDKSATANDVVIVATAQGSADVPRCITTAHSRTGSSI